MPATPRLWRRRAATVTLAVLPAAVLALGLAVNVARHGCYSVTWAVVVIASGLAVATPTVCLLAGLQRRVNEPRRPRRILAVVVVLVLALLPGIFPAPVVTRAIRWLDVAMGIAPMAAAGVVITGLLAVSLARPTVKQLAAAAALAWCVNIILALAVHQYHRFADSAYQQSAATGWLDEFPARLGADWQERYIEPVREMLAENRR